MTTTRRRR